MAHTTKCLSLVKGRRIRVTALDSCGRPIYGDGSQVTSKGFISVAFTANTTDSDEISVTNAAGEVCVFEAAVTSLTGYGIEISFCEVDPELFALVTGQPVVVATDGTVIGFDVDTKITLDDSNFALELWAGSPAGDACSAAGSSGSYGYLLLPFLKGGILGDFTVENGAVTFTLTGANTSEGNAWGTGPYKDIMLNPSTNVPEVQRATITGVPTGGTFTLTYAGQTTTAIAYNATAAVVQTALEALSNIAPGDVVVTGGPGPATPYTFTFGGALKGDVVAMTATGSFTGGTTPAIAITTITPGVAPVAGAMTSPVSTSVALRTMIVDLAPPTDACGARPVLDPSLPNLTSIAGVPTGLSVAFTATTATGPVWWDFGDGTWDYVAAPGTTTHIYSKAGTWTARASQNGKWVTANVTTI